MLGRIIYRTVRSIVKSKIVILVLICPILTWAATALFFSQMKYFLAESDKPPLVWHLDQLWKEMVKAQVEFQDEHEEFYRGHGFMKEPWRLEQIYFTNYAGEIVKTHHYLSIILLSFPILILTVVILNRLFVKGEMVLYLARPVDTAEIFFGTLMGVMIVCTFMVLMNLLILVLGAFPGEWRQVFPLLLLEFQSQFSSFFIVICLAFLFAPLAGNLFRGAATLIFSAVAAFLGCALPLREHFWDYIAPYGFNTTDPLHFKCFAVLANLFASPIPRTLNSASGLNMCTDSLIHARGTWELSLTVLNHPGYWIMPFFSGVMIMVLACWVWDRKEY